MVEFAAAASLWLSRSIVLELCFSGLFGCFGAPFNNPHASDNATGCDHHRPLSVAGSDCLRLWTFRDEMGRIPAARRRASAAGFATGRVRPLDCGGRPWFGLEFGGRRSRCCFGPLVGFVVLTRVACVLTHRLVGGGQGGAAWGLLPASLLAQIGQWLARDWTRADLHAVQRPGALDSDMVILGMRLGRATAWMCSSIGYRRVAPCFLL